MDRVHTKMFCKCWDECMGHSCGDCRARFSALCSEIYKFNKTESRVEKLHTLMFGEKATAKMLGGEK